jgi:hypothetical protein
LHKVLVIQEKDLDEANAFCNTIGAVGDTFSVALYDADDVLAGYWCGWNMSEDQLKAVESNNMFAIYDTAAQALEATGWHVNQDA